MFADLLGDGDVGTINPTHQWVCFIASSTSLHGTAVRFLASPRIDDSFQASTI